MPRRTNTITKSRSKTRSRSRKSRSKTTSRTRTNSINKTRSTSRSRRKYRGGCNDCKNSTSGTWKSTGPMYGGSNPDQISKDIFSHVTNSIVRSVA